MRIQAQITDTFVSDLEKKLQEAGIDTKKIEDITKTLKDTPNSPPMPPDPNKPEEAKGPMQTPTTDTTPDKVSQPGKTLQPGKPLKSISCVKRAGVEDIWKKLNWMERDEIIEHLTSAGIQAYEHESDDELREALYENIQDGTIELDANKKTAGQVTLESGDFGFDYYLVDDDGHDILIQTDWDYPGIASNMGWVPCDKCSETDGTVDCEHKTATQMIGEAKEFLDEHIGESFEDPGYFDSLHENAALKKLSFVDKYLAVWAEPPAEHDKYDPPAHMADAADEDGLKPKEKHKKILKDMKEKPKDRLLHVVQDMFDKEGQFQEGMPSEKEESKDVQFSDKTPDSNPSEKEEEKEEVMGDEITEEDAKELGTQIGIDWETVEFTPEQFRKGFIVELEHTDDPETSITDDPEVVGKITLRHLREMSDYYERLAEMESSSTQPAEPEEHDVEESEPKEEKEVEAENIGGAVEDTTSGDTKLY